VPPGKHPIVVKLIHADIPGGASREQWELEIPESGGDVQIRRVE